MKILQVRLHLLLFLSLFKTSNADSPCSYYYDHIPQTINCEPMGGLIKLVCIVRVSRDHPTTVKWFWNQTGPAASPEISEALNDSEKYVLNNRTIAETDSDGLRQDKHCLTIKNFTLPVDSGYYWCQIVVNGTVLLQPPPPLHISTGPAKCMESEVIDNNLEPDQCAANEVEQICSSLVRPVSTHLTTSMDLMEASSVVGPSVSSLKLQLSTELIASTLSSSIVQISSSLVRTVSTHLTTSTDFMADSSEMDPLLNFSSTKLIASTLSSSIVQISSSLVTVVRTVSTPNTHSSTLTTNAASVSADNIVSPSLHSLQLQHNTELIAITSDSSKVPPVTASLAPDVTNPSSNDTKSLIIAVVVCVFIAAFSIIIIISMCIYIYCSKKRKKSLIAAADKNRFHKRVSTQLELQDNTAISFADNTDSGRPAPSLTGQDRYYSAVSADSTTYTDCYTEQEYALPFEKSSGAHVYDAVKEEGETIPGLTEPKPHYYSVIRDDMLPSSNTKVCLEPCDSARTMNEKRTQIDSGKPFYHTLERESGQSIATVTGKEKAPVTKVQIPPSVQTPVTFTNLHNNKDLSHHSPVAMEHPPDDASSSSTYAEPWNVKQGSAEKPAPFYHTLERSTKQSETATADPKPVTPSGVLIPPSTRTPATSSSLNDHNDWSHHSSDPTVAKAHSSDCVSSVSIQYAEPYNIKTMQDSVKKPALLYHTLEPSTKQSEETTIADPKPVMSPESDSAEIQAHSLGMSDAVFDDPAYLPASSTFTTSQQ